MYEAIFQSMYVYWRWLIVYREVSEYSIGQYTNRHDNIVVHIIHICILVSTLYNINDPTRAMSRYSLLMTTT